MKLFGKDIQYKEGILEFLSENKNVDTLIISELLDGEMDFINLIDRILKINNSIEIIVFLEDDDSELKSYLYKKGIYKIYQNNQIDIKELTEILNEETSKNADLLNEEIRKLKQIIEDQKNNINENTKLGKITSVIGPAGSRKEHFNLCII